MRKLFSNFNFLYQYDWILMALVFVLSAFSFAAIYSIDLSRGDELIYFPTQFLAFIIGFVAIFVISGFHISFYQSLAKPIYIFSLILLVAVLVFGQSIRGTTGWFKIGGFSFQPAEFAKMAEIIMIGYLTNIQGRRFDKLQFVVLSGILSSVFIFLILLQPDLGSALVIGAIWFLMLILSGTKKRYIFALVLAFLMAFLVGWNFLFKDYQKDRLLIFLYPEKELLGAGYNVNQSIIAIGAGRLFGRGLGFGSQSQLHFLPEAQTDFIFSVLAEELGFFGVFIVLLAYFLIILRLLKIAVHGRDDFSSYMVLGIALMFFIQIVFNIGAATGLLPVTGLTLPFMSYGGSSLVINLALIGLVQSVARSNWENQKKNAIFG